MRRIRGVLCALVVVAAACRPTLSEPAFVEGGLNVLFIGNSLTYANHLPAMVAELAAATGQRPLNAGVVAGPDMNLEDHWLSGQARAAIRSRTWDVVVLQQGPSSLPENQLHLREWAVRFADEIRAHGARPALYMVWPAEQHGHLFDAVVASYTAAAQAADAELLPAGAAWRAAWARDAGMPLYDADRFHPSRAGSYLAALVIFRRLYDASLEEVPARLARTGVTLDAQRAAVLRAAALEVTP